MLHFDCDRDEPPACTIGNRCTHDLALQTQFFAHVDLAQLWDVECMPVNRELIVCQVEAQSITLLAFEVRKARFLPILAWMFELGLCLILFHAPVVGEGLSQINKGLFWSAFGHFIAPRELLALDLVVFCLEVFHLDPLTFCPCFFPASQCPIVCVASNTASLAKVHLLLRHGIQSDQVRAVHVIPLAFPVFAEDEPTLAVQADQSSPPCFHGIRPRPI